MKRAYETRVDLDTYATRHRQTKRTRIHTLYGKEVVSDAIRPKFVGKVAADGRRLSAFSLEMGQRTRMRALCPATATCQRLWKFCAN